MHNNKKEKQFEKIRVRNIWGNLEYFLGEGELKKGQELLFQFPDGATCRCMVEGKQYSESICDMGHEYTTTSTRLFITKNVSGILLEIPLESLKAQVDNKQ